MRQLKSEVQQVLMSESKILPMVFDSQGIFWALDASMNKAGAPIGKVTLESLEVNRPAQILRYNPIPQGAVRGWGPSLWGGVL